MYSFSPCVRSQLKAAELSSSVQLLHPQECVEQAVELVRRNVLTEMDGRDLARCLALEASNETFAYTVSMEHGSVYVPRHLTANFNRHSFCREIQKAWSKKIKFRQIILDYFWIPPGSWAMTHWGRTFFTTTLPSFVTEDLLDTDSGEGIVYLPFCVHCMAQVVGAVDILSEYYDISFLYKDELSQHALWLATSTISPYAMQTWLGKDIKQEDIYCTFTLQDVLHGVMDDAYVLREDLLKVLGGIEDFDKVRMIKMQVKQRSNRTVYSTSGKSQGEEKKEEFSDTEYPSSVGMSAFITLKDPTEVVRGIFSGSKMPPGIFSRSKMPPFPRNKEKEQKSPLLTDDDLSIEKIDKKRKPLSVKGSKNPPKKKLKEKSVSHKKKQNCKSDNDTLSDKSMSGKRNKKLMLEKRKIKNRLFHVKSRRFLRIVQ